jgi:hypothetical protein
MRIAVIALLLISLLLLVVLTLAPAEAGTRLPRWEQKRVRVYDYAGPEWQVQGAVASFNEMLPKHAPRLVYVPMSGPCEERLRAIAVCAVPAEQLPDSTAAGQTIPTYGGQGRMQQAVILLSTKWPPPGRWLACHELTHAMGALMHGSWSADNDPPPEACPYDAQTMKQLYKKKKMRHR